VKLIGKNGNILVGDKESTAVIVKPILEKKYGSVVVFDNKDLQKWIKRLRIESTDDGRISFSSWDHWSGE
jgi:hypothetical protein